MLKKLIITVFFCVSFFYGTSKVIAAILTSPEVQFERLVQLKKDRAPDAPFPELLPQFIENSTAIAEILDGAYLETFNKIYDHVLAFFGENGENLTLAHFNIVHLYYAKIVTESQLNSIIDEKFLFDNLKEALNFILNKDYDNYGIFYNGIGSEHIKPTMYVEFNLYPYTIVSESGYLSLKVLNESLGQDMRLCGFPLFRSKFDGYLNQTSMSCLTHDWAHASPVANFVDMCNEDGVDKYKALLGLINLNQDQKIQNLDHFCLFFLEHENYRFYRGEFNDLETDCNFVLNNLFDIILPILHNYSATENGISAIEVFQKFAPSKIEPFFLDMGDVMTIQMTGALGKNFNLFQVLNSRFGIGYNILFDIQSMLKDSDIDFQIWKDDQFNAEEMSAIITKIFSDFKERYKDKF
ncbi:MAG: hypothetical protein Q8L85_00630 [Alphaproteobacteria bacterium]|nr:hypothetical protein [Alphaproteobacteria bacterium]